MSASSNSPTRDSSNSSPKNRSLFPVPQAPSSYFTFPVSYAVGGILRRISTDVPPKSSPKQEMLTPPVRKFSPFQPPPLTPLTLSGWQFTTKENSRLLTRTLAEEIRLLVPPRLQLEEEWKLLFSLEQDGVSLSTLYKKCEDYRGKRGGYVLVIRDGMGGIFGAYLSDALHAQAHFYGTGECFLWRSSVLPAMPDMASLPPPPSADTTNAQRQTTLLNPRSPRSTPNTSNGASRSGTSTPERIRFKAFPYSGINDYMIYCEAGYLSVGGGDGHYGLWLDDSLEKGISSTCLTFGNEPLSDEGKKFEVMGVELWYIGN
ncbi:hypothetical protein FKW77_002571 [Venturia effusa]|uniref:Oxidation resistance protein 1 n=1 Tax=Venturia effusa TaxID=50376 RepID=A0A517L6W1_9PEZI|nr:hypothetical protein FKW77_002571 [Venturia effusa]